MVTDEEMSKNKLRRSVPFFLSPCFSTLNFPQTAHRNQVLSKRSLVQNFTYNIRQVYGPTSAWNSEFYNTQNVRIVDETIRFVTVIYANNPNAQSKNLYGFRAQAAKCRTRGENIKNTFEKFVAKPRRIKKAQLSSCIRKWKSVSEVV